MKVPFLNKRIKNEFDGFLIELENSVKANVTRAKTTSDREFFTTLYPLFVLIRTLSSAEYVRDPVRETVLAELKNTSKKRFLEAVTFFKRPHIYQSEFNTGMQRQVFTGYFQELFSDALLLLNSYYTHNYRSAQIALRCMLEDLYRHLYYRDHPQELIAIHDGSQSEYEMGISPRILREYLARTDYLALFRSLTIEFNPKENHEKTWFDVNEELYANSSSAVHGSGDSSLNTFESNLDFVYVDAKAKQALNAAKQFTQMAVAFLLSAHVDQFLSFSEYERSLVLAKYPDKQRAALRRVLNI
ncbi:hypothetical protein [Limnohabitans sp.]|uniref:hypothetical protein n=1 Tax=Limnohabitans sp. TaxID=1907725 RepID=UPI0025C45E2C|nr:hypothetical protein [Limnohabitans sp.]